MSGFSKATLFSVALSAMVGATDLSARDLPSTSEPIGDWRFECFALDERPDACQLHQRIVAENSNFVALAAALTVNAVGDIEAQIALPLGITLLEPPRLRLDGEVVASLPITRCTNDGCIIEGVLPTGLVAQLLDAETADIIVFSPENNTLTLPFPLRGLADGLARLETVKPVPEPDRDATGDPEALDQS
ncbi:Invasion protein IalB, involved in pathogenesis [Roseivivax lentus]|uniref:Invasion protein IalB, involved in pathogenesis n=2 Tax=Roseivivax lentus TaxID=633194 RepID=A0A1N7NA64_9RHOB|nr:Invasion protein IalB, involved in pathogenesis [Roseivivax lentus]